MRGLKIIIGIVIITTELIIRNGITKEQRPLTQEQFEDNNYTLNIS